MNLEDYVIYVIDTETTGLDPVKHDVIEISACRFRLSNVKEKEQETWFLKALTPSTIQEEALNINKHKLADITHRTKAGREKYKEPPDAVIAIEQWVMEDGASSMDRVFAGQNPNFDIAAMVELWKKVESPETFPFSVEKGDRVLDTKQLALMADLCTGRRRQFYNLMSLVKSFGAKRAKAHTAAGDVLMTTDVLIKILGGIKAAAAEKFNECYID